MRQHVMLLYEYTLHTRFAALTFNIAEYKHARYYPIQRIYSGASSKRKILCKRINKRLCMEFFLREEVELGLRSSRGNLLVHYRLCLCGPEPNTVLVPRSQKLFTLHRTT
ncbi:unnamed protein product [Trichogramma brassicae]|uniref:Uncharacterized protein n=1 Tax=Trichogramma brassicae TaxID=86971 RepID=A0A6H5ICW9_9HYME|nr:unnamed protein product [Trichogramma brassicae]